jgi:ribosomal-protein-alanine N-acetyltransferase
VASRGVNARVRVHLRRPRASDTKAFLSAVRRSRHLHRGWVKPPGTRAEFRRYLRRLSSPSHRSFLVARKRARDLVGIININNIILGQFRSGFLGYYAFGSFAKQGLMREGMRLVLRHAFKKLKLHRLEANIQPTNRRSIALARDCGFTKEGYSRRYLKIGGKWRDHERWAILAEDLPAQKKPALEPHRENNYTRRRGM